MLQDFLSRTVTLQRASDSIFSGDVAASIAFTQLTEAAYLNVTVVAATSLTFAVAGSLLGSAVSEDIEIVSEIGNRGFQQFDWLASITCSGTIAGEAKITLLNEDSEPLMSISTVGEYSADSRYGPESRNLEPFGEEDEVRKIHKFYFDPAVNILPGDTIVETLDKYRVESVVELKSLIGVSSHKEATVSKFEAEKDFEAES